MAKAIETYLGVRKPRPTPDVLFDAVAVPQNATLTSAAANLGETQGALELVIFADTAIGIAGATSLTVTYEYTASTAFDTSVELYTAAGAATLAAGELARFIVPTDFPTVGRVKVITTDAAATGTISVYPEYVSR